MEEQAAVKETGTAPAPHDTAGGAAWNAWHLHLGTAARSAHDRVLSEVIGPVVDTVPARPWFFIRYWQAGPHLRLRIGDLEDAERDRVEELLAERFAEAGQPAEGEEPIRAEEYGQSAARMTVGESGRNRFVEDLLPPGVHRAVYEPEVERYGGPELMPRTERLFQLSSELVRAMMPHAQSQTRRAVMALRATISAAASLGDGLEQAHYYARGVESWSRYVADYGHSAEQIAQICHISDEVAAVGAKFHTGEHGPFAGWYRELSALCAEVRRRTTRHPGEILSSHVHMLHNRLGLRMHEELRTYAWLAHLHPVPAGQEAANSGAGPLR